MICFSQSRLKRSNDDSEFITFHFTSNQARDPFGLSWRQRRSFGPFLHCRCACSSHSSSSAVLGKASQSTACASLFQWCHPESVAWVYRKKVVALRQVLLLKQNLTTAGYDAVYLQLNVHICRKCHSCDNEYVIISRWHILRQNFVILQSNHLNVCVVYVTVNSNTPTAIVVIVMNADIQRAFTEFNWKAVHTNIILTSS